MDKAVFLDRDGTINEEVNYLHKIEDFRFIPNTIKALQKLSKTNYKIIIISNQPVIGIGTITENNYLKLQEKILEKFKKNNIRIDATYYCPHHPKRGIGKYLKDCEFRKPKPGMLLKAANDLEINLQKSFMIGDKRSDIKAGSGVGCRTILVKTGYGGKGGDTDFDVKPNYVAKDLYEAINLILKQ